MAFQQTLRGFQTGFIYTMNVTEEMMREWGYPEHFKRNEITMRRIFGDSEYMCSFDTYQFKDYAKMVAPRFDPEKKARRRREIFPIDCRKAFDMGARFVRPV